MTPDSYVWEWSKWKPNKGPWAQEENWMRLWWPKWVRTYICFFSKYIILDYFSYLSDAFCTNLGDSCFCKRTIITFKRQSLLISFFGMITFMISSWVIFYRLGYYLSAFRLKSFNSPGIESILTSQMVRWIRSNSTSQVTGDHGR